MPIDFVIVRASSIPPLVSNERSRLKAGITGGDILWEFGSGKNAGESMPLSIVNPNAKRSALYVGVAKSFMNYVQKTASRRVTPADLSGTMVATKYPRIAADYFTEKSVANVDLFYVPGTDEAMQYIFSDCVGILGIISSGKTTKANDIEVIEQFYEVTLRMIDAEDKLTRKDRELLDDFRERIAVAVQKKTW